MAKTKTERKRRAAKREEEKKKQREERKRRKGKLKKLRTCTITNGENFVDEREGRPHFNRYFPSKASRKRKGHPLGARAKKRL